MFVSSTLHLLSIFVYFTGATALRCAYLKLESSTEDSSDLSFASSSAIQADPSVQHCTQAGSFCFALWHADPSSTSHSTSSWPSDGARHRLIAAGCWNNTQDTFCSQSQCVFFSKPQKALNDTKFCCCYGNLCNSNFSIGERDASIEEEQSNLELESVNIFQDIVRHPLLLFVLIFVFFIFTVILVFTICYKSIYTNSSKILKHDRAMDSMHLLESHSLPTPHFPSICSNNLQDLSFTEIVDKGKYGTVWKGQLRGTTTVAIKVVTQQNKRYLANECRIYSLPFMTEPSLARFFGYTERVADDGQLECCMAIEYGHLGSLFNYLQQQSLDWVQLCRLAKSLAQGLAYLHTEISQDCKLKPSIAHRDLCSRNVIVKADGTCMICDFQFAVCFVNNKPLFLEDHGRTSVVGTLRYLAPELLEGAINLNHCESALKQADIYGLGLILWEIATRCTDLYQGIDVPSYKMPFEQETGQHVNFDQLRVLVGRHKARPLFPDIWKDSNPAIRLLKETIVECWDQEPEARLTALCIKERICELPLLWKRYKSETFANCCVVSSLQQLKNIQNTLNRCAANGGANSGSCGKTDACGGHKAQSSVLSDSLESKYLPSNCFINKFENSLHYKYNSHHHLLHHPYHKHHFYQINLATTANSKKQDLNSTVEKNMHAAANMSASASGQPKLSLPLQPHQARNLCIERNLMSDTSDEHDGLLEQGLKFQSKSYMKSNIATATGDHHHQPDVQEASDTDSGSGQPHYAGNRAPLIRPPLPPPISYVQNETSNQPVKAKETNKYQNRHEAGQPAWLSSKSVSLFEYIKQKFNLTHLNKSNRDKATKRSAKQSIGPLLEEWKENCEEKLEIAAAQIGTLLYAKDPATIGLEYSNQSINVCNGVGSQSITSLVSSTSHHHSESNLSVNSSPLISASECDLSLTPSDLLSKDKLAQLTNSSCIQNNNAPSQVERINNRIDSLGIFLACSGKMEPAIAEIAVDEPQLLHSNAP